MPQIKAAVHLMSDHLQRRAITSLRERDVSAGDGHSNKKTQDHSALTMRRYSS